VRRAAAMAGRSSHRLRRRSAAPAAGVVAALAFVLAGCAAAPHYTFIGSDKNDIVMKVPSSWKAVDKNAVLKASGVDPSTQTGWMVFYDAASKPSVQHLRTSSANDPVLVAQSFDISADQRASLTDDLLRNALLPVTQEARAAAAASTGATMASTGFKLISDQTLNSKTEHGVHVVFSYRVNGGLETFDQVAVTNPKKTRGHLLVVHCTQTCFAARSGEIAGVVSSLTLKSQ
jgi:hypothetical protein